MGKNHYIVTQRDLTLWNTINMRSVCYTCGIAIKPGDHVVTVRLKGKRKPYHYSCAKQKHVI